MAQRVFFEHVQSGRRYDVVNMNREAGEITLKGQHAEFVERYDKEKFARMGYVLKQEDDDAAAAG